MDKNSEKGTKPSVARSAAMFALLALAMTWIYFVERSSMEEVASCKTDKPINPIRCFDIGIFPGRK